MKKMILLMLLIPMIGWGQEPIKKPKNKNARERIIASGLLIIGGSVTSLVRSRQTEPEFINYTDNNQYLFDKKVYNTKQKDLQIVSSFFYIMSGVTLISITYDF